jgi:hypothetical protein
MSWTAVYTGMARSILSNKLGSVTRLMLSIQDIGVPEIIKAKK